MTIRIGSSLALVLALASACGDDTPATTNGTGSSGTGEPTSSTTDTPTPPATTEGTSSSGPGPIDGSTTSDEGTTSGTSTGDEGTTSGTSTGDEGTTSGTSTGAESSSGSESSSDTGVVGPGECNEMLGVPCVGMAFCDYPDGMCGAGANGTCQPIVGGFCPGIFDPQCGCDGVTHSNECVANNNGTDVDVTGSC